MNRASMLASFVWVAVVGGCREPLADATVDSVLRPARQPISNACLPAGGTLEIVVRVELDIRPDGTVDRVDASGDGASSPVLGCVTTHLRTLAFPRSAGRTALHRVMVLNKKMETPPSLTW
jgi:hypothetical protein